MPRQTVLYLNHSAQMSGAEASLRSLLLGLRRIEAPFDVVVGLPGEGPLTTVLREDRFSVTSAPLRRLQRPRGLITGMAALHYVFQTAPQIVQLAEKSQAQLIHSNSTTAHIVGGIAAEKAKLPTIWHCRDLVSLAHVAPRLASQSTQVVAISQCVAKSLEKDGVPREKIEVVYNGIDTDAWRPKSRLPLRERLGLTNEAFVFGMAGQLVPWKNHRAFIEAAAKLVQDEGTDHIHFLIVGGDLWEEHQAYTNELRALIKERNMTTRINFVPNQSNALGMISVFDCLVHPARDEPFGRILIEAMALEKPVIAMNANGPSEIITPGQDGILVNPDEEDGLANAMKCIVTDTSLREGLARQGRQTVKEKFHIETHARKMAEIYSRLTKV